MWMSRTRSTAALMAAALLLSACGGGGDSSPPIATAPPVVVAPPVKLDPIPVLKSSYENKIAAGKVLGPQNMPAEVLTSNSVAFGDFFQDGSYSMVTHSLEYSHTDPNTANNFGSVRFYKKVGSNWIDNTSKLLADVKGCLHPRKAIVADFNGDRKPDVFFACHGFDAPPHAGEKPLMLLSQTDGKYKNSRLPFSCYCHAATAADPNGQGYADILVTDNQANETVPFFLMNDKQGGFAKDFSRLPFKPHQYSAPNLTFTMVTMFTAELIDFDKTGRYDAFIAGTEPPDAASGIPPAIYKNDGTDNYKNRVVMLPTNAGYQTTLDIVFDGKSIYLNRVQTNNGLYGYGAIDKIDYQTMTSSTVYTNSTKYQNGMTWLNWIMQYQDKIVSQSDTYGVSVQ